MKKRGIGLALSGGSVRGLTHIGILKVLEENNIPIAHIAGTSIGALIGAAYCSGLSAKEIEKIALTTELKDLVDFTEPKTGFIAGRRIEKFIRKIIKDKNFKDLKIPLSIIAADINNGEKVVFEEGDVTQAVRASISIPGIFSSVKIGKRELVDGGIVDPVPVDILKDAGIKRIITVDLTMNFGEKEVPSKEPSDFIDFLKKEFYMKELEFTARYAKKFFIKFPKFLFRIIAKIIDKLLNPVKIYRFISGKTIPEIAKIMINSNMILINQLSIEILKKEHVDVIIKPNLKGAKIAEFEKAAELIKEGEIAAKKQLRNIRKLL